MDARIIAVNKAKGLLATYWEFDFKLGSRPCKIQFA